jgi:predicted transposase/invertase (TIGR01784 family)
MEEGTSKSKANQKRRMKPKNDFIFQKLFGEEESKESLASLLNAILGLEGEKRIRNLKVKDNKQLAKKMVDDKTGRLDISAESDDQVQYDIEMQLTDQRNMARRSLFYMSKMYIGSVKPGDDYSQLKRTVTINLLDFQLFKEREAFHTTFHLYDDRDKSLLLTDAFEVRFLELPKFERMKKDLYDPLHRWLMYLDERLSEHQLKELIEMDANIKKTEELLLRLSSDEETYRLYEAREHSLMERNSLIADGVAKGMEQGIKKGIEKGIEKGKKEVIKNMLKEGLEVDLIAKVTGFSVEEVRLTRDREMET